MRQAGSLIIYQDETWIFSGMSHRRDWIDKSLEKNPIVSYREYRTIGPTIPKEKGKRSIVIGASCEEKLFLPFAMKDGGFTDQGDYHKTMTAKIYKEWLIEMIPQFKAAADGRPITLIIDNAPYHNTIENAIPTTSSTKQKLIDFLEKQGIVVEDGLTKKELIDMMHKFTSQKSGEFNKKEVEELCRKEGIEVRT